MIDFSLNEFRLKNSFTFRNQGDDGGFGLDLWGKREQLITFSLFASQASAIEVIAGATWYLLMSAWSKWKAFGLQPSFFHNILYFYQMKVIQCP